jgi:hypothetical protein
MANRIDARMDSMQPASPNPQVHFFFTEATAQQLPPRHHPVLASRQLRQWPVIPASSRKPLLYTGFRGLAGHAPIVPGRGARVARTLGKV